ncbi:MAG TPA: response regulator transcription factor [Verrucomicrobiae bacterium]
MNCTLSSPHSKSVPMETVKILLADDHKIMRDGLKVLISDQSGLEVVGEAGDGAEAVDKTLALKPDLVLMDLSMPKMNGLLATVAIKARSPRTKVLVLTTHEDEDYLRELCTAHAVGYVLKHSASEELITAIRKVAAGGTHFDSDLVQKTLLHEAGPGKTPAGGHELSDREKEVLRQIAWGFSNKEIAAQLNISVKTVETYKVRIGEKLNLHSRAEIVRFAAAQGWLSDEHASMRKLAG